MRLCHGPLRGMFDAPTSLGERSGTRPASRWTSPRSRPGRRTSISRSRSRWSARPRSLTRNAANAPIDAQAAGARGREDDPGQRRGWRGAADRRARRATTRPRSSSARQTGVQHWMVLHRLSDLDAAGDDGTRQQASRRACSPRPAPSSSTASTPRRPRAPRACARALRDRGAAHRALPAGRRAMADRRPLLRGAPRPLRARARAHRDRRGDGSHANRPASRARAGSTGMNSTRTTLTRIAGAPA